MGIHSGFLVRRLIGAELSEVCRRNGGKECQFLQISSKVEFRSQKKLEGQSSTATIHYTTGGSQPLQFPHYTVKNEKNLSKHGGSRL